MSNVKMSRVSVIHGYELTVTQGGEGTEVVDATSDGDAISISVNLKQLDIV